MNRYLSHRPARFGTAASALAATFATAFLAWGLTGPAAAASPAAQRAVALTARQSQPERASRRPGLVPSALAAFVWSTDATLSVPPDPYYAFNSTGQPIVIKILKGSPPGSYLVFLYGLGAITRPAADITPYQTQGTCSLAALSESGGGVWVASVTCLSLGAAPQNALFDLMITQPTAQPAGVLDYGLESIATFSGPLSFQYNSSHKINRVRHLGRGRYQVIMPGPRAKGVTGTVKLTVFGESGDDCEVAGWHGTASGQVIDIRCFSPSGVPRNDDFLVTYARRTNLLGLNGATSAYAYANQPGTASYQPGTQYGSDRHARVTVVRLAVGSYEVLMRGSGGPFSTNGGDVQISTVGTSDHHCRVLSWSTGTNPVAFVSCVSNAGLQADSRFTIQWVVA